MATDAVPEPVHHGATSGLTAIDRARHGNAQSVRVLVISQADGGRIAHSAGVVGYSVTVLDLPHAAREISLRHPHVAIVDLPSLGVRGGEALEMLHATTPPTPALVVDIVDDA